MAIAPTPPGSMPPGKTEIPPPAEQPVHTPEQPGTTPQPDLPRPASPPDTPTPATPGPRAAI